MALAEFERILKVHRKHLLLDPDDPAAGPWLLSSGRCRACPDQVLTPKMSDLHRHGSSMSHNANVARLLGRTVEGTKGAPSEEDFLQVLKDRVDMKSFRSSAVRGCGREKALRMTWCLSQALLGTERKFLKQASVICLLQDVRKSTLLVRYTAVCGRGRVREGVLGAAADFGGLRWTSSARRCRS